jgi:hypothetical protein
MQATSMDSTPKARRRKSRSDLVHLRSLPSTQPATKIGQVAWAWAEIEAGLAAGMKLKEVWEAAGRDGLEMSYAQFRVCVSRLRRRRQKPSPSMPEQPPPQTIPENWCCGEASARALSPQSSLGRCPAIFLWSKLWAHGRAAVVRLRQTDHHSKMGPTPRICDLTGRERIHGEFYAV